MDSINNNSIATPKPTSLPTCIQKLLPSTPSSPATEIMIQLFSDRIFIVISQLSGKLGTLLQCTHEHSVIDNSHSYHVETLLGKRDDAQSEVYIRNIMERIVKLGSGGGGSGSHGTMACPPILLGIALKPLRDVEGGLGAGQEMFHTIINEVLSLYKEGIRVASMHAQN